MNVIEHGHLIEYLQEQGIPREAAKELAERKRSQPRLVACEWRGRMVNLELPSPQEGRKFDEMLAAGNVPGIMTDAVFLQGHCSGNQFVGREDYGDYVKKVCESEGGTTLGRVYKSSLARHPGDKEAWIGGRGDVQKLLEKRGGGCDGAVTVKARGMTEEPPPPVGVADDLVDRETAKELAGHVVSEKEAKETREKVKDRLMPRWKRGKKTRKG